MPALMTGTGLSAAVRRLLGVAVEHYRQQPQIGRRLRRELDRLDEPLRVAIAGKVKAGKSTLINALIGEPVAPTDAGECTRVVTWYRDGRTPRIVMHRVDSPPLPLLVVRRDGALVIDLQGTPADRVDRLLVDWPAHSLRAATLIDTPGTESMSADTAGRAGTFLDPGDDTPTEADAVIYLMRHLHATDAHFLEAFRDTGVARATAVNTIAVVSRADEIGGARVDAMFSARAIAQRYRVEPALRGLCQNVVAVAGLLAHTGRTLRLAEFAALGELARMSRADLDTALLSADRFVRPDGAVAAALPALSDEARRELLARFGLFGIRLTTMLIRQGVDNPADLATEMVARSGLLELQRVLHNQFTGRSDVLKARSALLAVDRALHAVGDGDSSLAAEVDRIFAVAHEFTEIRLLGLLRSGAFSLPASTAEEAERLLGGVGTAPAVRLGLPVDSDPGELRLAACAALGRWQRHAVNPMFGRATTGACRAVVRTCEGLLANLAGR